MTQLNIKELTKRTRTRYLKRTNTLKSSNFEMNLLTLDAYSYGWWKFCTKLNDKVIFNSTIYSMSTCKHQNKALSILDYSYDLRLVNTTACLSNLEVAFNHEIKNTKDEVLDLIKTIKKPRTRKSTNNDRRAKIKSMIKHINKVRAFKNQL